MFKSLQILPVKGLPIISNWSIVWLKGKKHSQACLAYLEYLKQEKEQVIQKNFAWDSQY